MDEEESEDYCPRKLQRCDSPVAGSLGRDSPRLGTQDYPSFSDTETLTGKLRTFCPVLASNDLRVAFVLASYASTLVALWCRQKVVGLRKP